MSHDAPSRDRRARRRGPGLASALLGGALLIALGFGLGVVAGLMLEEPDLILDYAAGRTREVALEGGPGASATAPVAPVVPDVAARPPPDFGATHPAPEPDAGLPAPAVGEHAAFDAGTAAPAVDAALPVPDSAPPSRSPSDGFAVQVGAFSDASAAEQLARRLRAGGWPVYVAPAVSGEAERWRVRVGPMASRENAEQVAKRLESEERLSTWVLAESSH